MSDDAPPPALPTTPPSTPGGSGSRTLPSGPGGGLPRWVPFAAVAAIVVVVVVLVLVLSGGNDDSDNTAAGGATGSSGTSGTTVAKAPSKLTSAAEVTTLGKQLGRPIYWAGPAGANTTLELTQTGANVYLRYLTGGAQPGDPRPMFLTVGSYVQTDPQATIRAAIKAPGAQELKLPDGALGVYNPMTRPMSAYLAFRGGKELVEVFSPTAGRAKTLVQSRRIRPVSG